MKSSMRLNVTKLSANFLIETVIPLTIPAKTGVSSRARTEGGQADRMSEGRGARAACQVDRRRSITRRHSGGTSASTAMIGSA